MHIFGCNYGTVEMLILHKQGLKTKKRQKSHHLSWNHIWVLCKLAREFLVVAWSTTPKSHNSNIPKVFPKFSSIFSSQVKKRRSMEMIGGWGYKWKAKKQKPKQIKIEHKITHNEPTKPSKWAPPMTSCFHC